MVVPGTGQNDPVNLIPQALCLALPANNKKDARSSFVSSAITGQYGYRLQNGRRHHSAILLLHPVRRSQYQTSRHH
jgi:hypothetical protein